MAPRTPVEKTSPDLPAEQVAKLHSLFPEAVSEGRVDWGKLRATLGELVDDRPERYAFTWAGKRDCIRLLQTPSAATLVPCPEESVDWDTTGNLFIEGENLEVLKLLYKAYFGRVKMIYIDPPYNTGNDFVYPDDFSDPLSTYLRLTGQRDAEGNLLTSNPETSGRYHSAWLSMMYPRLFLARQLLREDGVIFVSIDDHEVHNLRLLMNEVFGEENFIATVIWEKKYSPQNDAKWVSDVHEYVLLYARSKEIWRPTLLPRTDEQNSAYKNPDDDPRGPWKATDATCNKSRSQRPNLHYPILNPHTREEVYPPGTRVWAYSREVHQGKADDNRVWWGPEGMNRMPAYKTFLSEVKQGRVPTTLWSYQEAGHTQQARQHLNSLIAGNPFETAKPPDLVRLMLQIGTIDGEDIVLDFYAGSATTAEAVLAQNREDGGNRRFIMVQLPEPTGRDDHPTIADIGKERIRRVAARMQSGDGEQMALPLRDTAEDLGFRVFKLAPSHYRAWQGVAAEGAEAYTEEMALFTDALQEGWTAPGVLWEVALKEGYGLDSAVEALPGLVHNTVYRVTDAEREQSFTICLDDALDGETLRALNLDQEDLFVCRDSALDDALAANLALQCRLKTI